jgi:hypothetical protein
LKKGAAKNFLSTSGGSVEDEAKREKSVFPFCIRNSLETVILYQLLNSRNGTCSVSAITVDRASNSTSILKQIKKTEVFNIAEILLVIITGIYAIFTVLIWYSNKRSAKATENTLEETRLARQLAHRPEVIAFFYKERGILYFQIKNIGSRLAFDTKVKIDPIFNLYVFLTKHNFMQKIERTLQKDIKVLAPDQKLENFVQVYNEMMSMYYKYIEDHPEEKEILDSIIFLTYYDYEGNKYEESYDISLLDFEHHQGEIRLGIDEGIRSIQSIDRKLETISGQIQESDQ